jgi:hypothetical protein
MNPLIQCKTTILSLLTTLVFACLALSPLRMTAAGGGQTSTVRVVNTPSEPVPTSATGTTTVAGTVAATQSGPWSVDVSNTAASPVPFRDVDNPARQPFQAQVMGGFADGASTTGDITLTTVPAGKRLVIEYVSIFGAMITDQKMIDASVKLHSGFSDEYDFHSYQNAAHTSVAGLDYFVSSGPVRFYSGPGPVYCFAERNSIAGANPNSVTFTISGYFVDCPTCVP